MTFGQIKSIIENNLLETYKTEKEFKKSLREFKQNVLNNKSMSKVYNLYDQLSTSQGLSESDAKEFLEEGINLIQKILPSIKTPKSITENIENKYSDIDTVVYSNMLNLLERIEAKKKIVKILSAEKKTVSENINIPIKSMVSIANQTLNNYIDNIDEESKKEFLRIISEDTKSLETEFEVIRESTISKLNSILEKEEENDVKNTISETINRIKDEKFDQLNLVKLKLLEKNI